MDKKRNRFYIVARLLIFTTLAITSIFLIIRSNLSRTNKEIRRFEKTFGLDLPESTSIIFSEDTHGALGDGNRLYIYQINQKDMMEFIKQSGLRMWSLLPINEELYTGLYKRINYPSNKKIADAIKPGLDCKFGYYLIRNEYNKPLKGYDFRDLSYYNIILGIINLKNNQIYYYTFDM